MHHDKIEEIIHISNLLNCFSCNITYCPAHCGITQNEEADRLAKVGVQYCLSEKGNKLSNSQSQKLKHSSLKVPAYVNQ